MKVLKKSRYNLVQGIITDFKNQVKNSRGLAKTIASSTSYNHNYFDSLASFFNLSILEMTIRLEELNLVKFSEK